MPNKEYGPQNKKYPTKALGKDINVKKGSELPGTGKKMSAIKSDLKRNPSEAISIKSRGIQTPSIKITSSGGGQFTRSANRPRSKAPMGETIKTVKTTAKDKPINYNLQKAPQKTAEEKTSKNNYGG